MMKRLAVLGGLLLGIGVAANGCVVHPRVGADVTFSTGHHHGYYAPPPRHVCYHGCGHGGYVVVERHGYGHGHGGGYHHGGRRGGPRGRHW